MVNPVQVFSLTVRQLAEIRDKLCYEILKGLSAHNQEIRAFPAFLRPPSTNLCGEAVGLDVGGTNMRAAWIKIKGTETQFLAGPVQDHDGIMRRSEKPNQVSDGLFFTKQSDLIAQICPRQSLKVGYCFSYPTEVRPDCSATLIKWTKGINIPNVIGTSVGERLSRALRERGIIVLKIPVLNDTVASLISGSLIAPEYTHHIGLIAGTGTNMAGFFPVRDITKLAGDKLPGWREDDQMAVNLESGNFSPPHLTEYDDLIDSFHVDDNPGTQRFEKAVSGNYLPKLLCRMAGSDLCAKRGLDLDSSDVHAGTVASLRGRPGAIGQAAVAVLDRSADLLAAGTAGLIRAYGEGPKRVGILVEGSLFWLTSGYSARFEQTLSRLIESDTTANIMRLKHIDANLLGAACAALSVQSAAK